VLAVALLKG